MSWRGTGEAPGEAEEAEAMAIAHAAVIDDTMNAVRATVAMTFKAIAAIGSESTAANTERCAASTQETSFPNPTHTTSLCRTAKPRSGGPEAKRRSSAGRAPGLPKGDCALTSIATI